MSEQSCGVVDPKPRRTQLMTAVVLDASAAAEITARSTLGRRLLALAPCDRTWWVPDHFHVETAGAVRRMLMGNVIDDARATAAILCAARSERAVPVSTRSFPVPYCGQFHLTHVARGAVLGHANADGAIYLNLPRGTVKSVCRRPLGRAVTPGWKPGGTRPVAPP